MALRKALFPGNPPAFFTEATALALCKAAWPQAVGARLADRTEVLGLDHGMLLVAVPDGRWRRILHRLQREILSRMWAVAGGFAPRRLGFVERPMPPPEPAATQPEPPGPLPEIVQRAADTIGDTELRSRFAESARRYLARPQAPTTRRPETQ
jgi:hypothetical protein